jgi:hypothetical protein
VLLIRCIAHENRSVKDLYARPTIGRDGAILGDVSLIENAKKLASRLVDGFWRLVSLLYHGFSRNTPIGTETKKTKKSALDLRQAAFVLASGAIQWPSVRLRVVRGGFIRPGGFKPSNERDHPTPHH